MKFVKDYDYTPGPMPAKDSRSSKAFALIAIATLGTTFVASSATAQNRRESEAQLQTVRKEIRDLETRLKLETTRRDDGAEALRAAETAIAAATRKLAAVRAELGKQRTVQRTLGEQAAQANRRLAAERAALAQQVRLSYMTGREELFKLLLSQESPANLGRMLVYYDYFNRARMARIGTVSAELTRLGELDQEAARVERELAALEAEQAVEVTKLATARDERRAAVAKLDAEIANTNAAVAKLRGEERRLGDLVKQLTELLEGLPVEADQPFASLKGKLAWPVQGRLAGDFGQLRDGGPVKWNGVLLDAAAGAAVRAVYHGRVAFADWLPGLGLLLIVDHGGGYMSLYGHNGALLKEAGDWVEPGETIAQVGDTGGQPRPGLYFEIRFNGEPVSPHPWIARRPAAR